MSDACINRIEECWKIKTTASNDLFNEEKYEDALWGYKDALYRAEVLNNYTGDCIRGGVPFMQVYIISCSNVANTYLALGQKEEAGSMLKRVIYYLLHLALQPDMDIDEIQHELKRAAMEYTSFIEKTDGDKQQQETVFQDLKEQVKASCR
jgi:hypothetical protein